jgi:hypothetical protein
VFVLADGTSHRLDLSEGDTQKLRERNEEGSKSLNPDLHAVDYRWCWRCVGAGPLALRGVIFVVSHWADHRITSYVRSRQRSPRRGQVLKLDFRLRMAELADAPDLGFQNRRF